MKLKLTILAAFLAIGLNPAAAVHAHSHAAPGHQRMFVAGQPLALADLPDGRARSRLVALPAAARQNALDWLQRFSFPESDLEFLHFDDEGAVLYVDPPAEDAGEPFAATLETDSGPFDSEHTFRLHSRPGAAKVVFLDFDGHELTDTAWNAGMPEVLHAQPFNLDGDAASFSEDERRKIHEIWHRVAEDYAPFDIDVTTEDPGIVDPDHGHIVITRNTDALGAAMPHAGGGGVAYIGVFGGFFYDWYAPALVYYNNLGSNPPYIADAATHEFGHNLGLSHDGRVAPYAEAYYYGHGSGYVSWAPIMGVGYYRNVTQWSKGDYAYANNTQDDLAIIAAELGLRPDDHGDSLSDPTPLAVEADGTILVSNPETEQQVFPSADNKGVIGVDGDVDVFVFRAGAGGLSLSVEPAWAGFYRDTRRGANLDVGLTLYDQFGNPVASADPTDETAAALSMSVPAGTYYLAVGGVENGLSPYSAYGSLGQYFISGQVAPPEPGGAPKAPAWVSASILPNQEGQLGWDDASSNESGFRVERSQDLANWSSLASLPADTTAYTDPGVEASIRYYYRIVAFNDHGASHSATVSLLGELQSPTMPGGVSPSVVSSPSLDGQVDQAADQAADQAGIPLQGGAVPVAWDNTLADGPVAKLDSQEAPQPAAAPPPRRMRAGSREVARDCVPGGDCGQAARFLPRSTRALKGTGRSARERSTEGGAADASWHDSQ